MSGGQLALESCGDGDRCVLLLPQSPLGSLQYRQVLPALAAHGMRATALDLMGYGASDTRTRHWSIEDFADSVLEAIEALGVVPVALVAGHFAAQVAIEAAVRAPAAVSRLVLDGTPLFPAATRDKLRAAPPPPPVTDDGAHAAEIWRRMITFLGSWDPTLRTAHAASDGVALRALYANFLRTNYEPPVMPAIGAHDTVTRLALVALPVLALTADNDGLKSCHDAVLATARDARGHRFAGRHPLQALDGGPARPWLDVVLPFLTGQAGESAPPGPVLREL